eukprot:COSAG02_NODE_1593_length_11778_cov_25.088792_1_plen_387_part_00
MAPSGVQALTGNAPALLVLRAAAGLLLSLSSKTGPVDAQRPGTNCTFTAPSGDFYDITELVRRGGDYVIEPQDAGSEYEYYWNSCGGVSPRGGTTLTCDSSDAACQHVKGTDDYYSLGKLDTVQYVESRPGFLVARYTGGSSSNPSGSPRQITVEMECDPSAEDPRFEMTDPTGVNYLLIVHSAEACVRTPPPPPSPPPPSNTSCTYNAPSGNRYSIAALANATSDWTFPDLAGEYDYHWNSCNGLVADIPPTNPEADCSPGSNGTPRCGCRAGVDAGCQAYQETSSEYGPYSLGTLATGEYRETFASDGSSQLSVLYRDGANLEHRCLASVAWKARNFLGMSSLSEDHTCSLVLLMLSLHRMFRCGRSTVWSTFVARGLRVRPRC